MNRLLRGIALAAAGAAAMSLYRQWQRMPDGQRRRHHLETWENEGGALPESTPQPEADVHATGATAPGQNRLRDVRRMSR